MLYEQFPPLHSSLLHHPLVLQRNPGCAIRPANVYSIMALDAVANIMVSVVSFEALVEPN